MLNGIHFLLTYACNFECDHCFLYCSPWSKGTFNIGQVTRVLDEARKIGTVEWIFFEGGEPFLFYPLLLEKLADGLPLRPWQGFRECPYEELSSPSRVHVDAFGHVQVCQGISIGNMWEVPLSEIITDYQPAAHPICDPLIRGGPAELASACGQTPAPGYIDECHLCFLTRKAAIEQYPYILAPRQVYGLE